MKKQRKSRARRITAADYFTPEPDSPPPVCLHARHAIALRELMDFVTEHLAVYRELEIEGRADPVIWKRVDDALKVLRQEVGDLMLATLSLYDESHDAAYREAQKQLARSEEYVPVEQLHRVILMMRTGELPYDEQQASSTPPAGAPREV